LAARPGSRGEHRAVDDRRCHCRRTCDSIAAGALRRHVDACARAHGSISAIVFLSARTTSAEEINSYLEQAARTERWNRVMTVTREPIVSSDIVGDSHAAIVDLSLTKVVDGDFCSVYSWYDNEAGYATCSGSRLERRSGC
jgi:glyceraldehyde 3-phosphate dehydrogenase-like protein